MNKGLKIAFLAIAATLAAVGVLLAIEYYKYRQSDEYRAIKELERLADQYKNDPYGGNTPEETLKLFIDALRVGNIDLAAKYFTLEQRDKWLSNLEKIKEGGELNSLIEDLDSATRSSDIASNSAQFSLTTNDHKVITVMNIVKISSNKWKIVDF